MRRDIVEAAAALLGKDDEIRRKVEAAASEEVRKGAASAAKAATVAKELEDLLENAEADIARTIRSAKQDVRSAEQGHFARLASLDQDNRGAESNARGGRQSRSRRWKAGGTGRGAAAGMSGRDRPSKDRVERFVRDFVVLWSEHVRLDSAGNTARVRGLGSSTRESQLRHRPPKNLLVRAADDEYEARRFVEALNLYWRAELVVLAVLGILVSLGLGLFV